MKKTLFLIGLVATITFFGCTTTQQTSAFKTISAVDQAAKAAFGGYIVAAEQGLVATNDIPKIKAVYQQVESDCLVAALTAQAGTNALATPNLTSELSALTTAIANVAPLTQNQNQK